MRADIILMELLSGDIQCL